KLFNLFAQPVMFGQIHRITAEAFSLFQSFRLHVSDDHPGSTEQLSGMSRCKTDRSGTCHIDCGAGPDPSGQSPMIACRENIRKHSQVEYLFHGPFLVREHQELEIRISYHHIFGLSADPAAHVHITVCCTRPVRVYICTYMRLLFTAHFTTSA